MASRTVTSAPPAFLCLDLADQPGNQHPDGEDTTDEGGEKHTPPQRAPGEVSGEHPELSGQLDVPVAESSPPHQQEHDVGACEVGQATEELP